MLTFSLIIATKGRSTELAELFGSLAAQNYPNLECVVVDQNPDQRVKEIVESWVHSLNLRVIDSVAGLSRARNLGLTSVCGDIVAFPDDDCWYTPWLLANVADWFEAHPQHSVLTVGACDRKGIPSGNRWIQDRCEIAAANVFRTTFSSTIFVRRTPATRNVRFDEGIGVGSGSRFSSGEETDYILQLLHAGVRGYFDRAWHIGHPRRDMLSGCVDGARASSYGAGMGHILRKRSQPKLLAVFVLYDLLRSALVALQGDWRSAGLCLRHAHGIASGYIARVAGSAIAECLPIQAIVNGVGAPHHLSESNAPSSAN